MSTEKGDTAAQKNSAQSLVPKSCAPAFDQLYFCLSPFYQGRYYYMSGEFDTCGETFRSFTRCVRSRLVSAEEAQKLYQESPAEPILKTDNHIWTFTDRYHEYVEERRQEHYSDNF